MNTNQLKTRNHGQRHQDVLNGISNTSNWDSINGILRIKLLTK